jgi:predicted nucleic acid-binding protein
MTVFVDNNVVLDVLLGRDEGDASTELMKKCESGSLTGFISSNCVYICAYLLYKKFRNNDNVKEVLLALMKIFEVATSPKEVLKDGCLSEFRDLEDAFQYHTAIQVRGITYIITRNTKDFKGSAIPAVTPAEFLERYFSK